VRIVLVVFYNSSTPQGHSLLKDLELDFITQELLSMYFFIKKTEFKQ
jgi:hypothetical protein